MRRVPDELAHGQAAPVDPGAGGRGVFFCFVFFRPDKKKQDTPPIVRLASPASKAAHYMCFDEAYFKTLETMQWNRDNGCVELIPIVVGLA